jgi:DNA-binding transcriptional LysR family regulator
MTLNLRELAVFRAVMEEGGVTAAAATLGMSQPAASKMLRQAEDRLGFALFRREATRLVPTPEAHALLPELLGAFATLDGLERLAGALRAGRSGQLSVAAVPVLATALLPRAVQDFRAARPEVFVRLRAMSALEVVNRVADHGADLGVILGGSGDARVESVPLATSEIGVALPPGHALAARRRVGLAELGAVPVISLGPGQPVGALLRAAQAASGVTWRVAVEVSQSGIACALVRAGAGVAVLDGYGLEEAAAQGLIVRPLAPRIPLEVTLVAPRGRVPSRLAAAFRAAVEAVAGQSGRQASASQAASAAGSAGPSSARTRA